MVFGFVRDQWKVAGVDKGKIIERDPGGVRKSIDLLSCIYITQMYKFLNSFFILIMITL